MMEKARGTAMDKRVGFIAVVGVILALSAVTLLFSACDNPVFGKLVNEQALFGRWNNPTFTSGYWPHSKYWDLDSLGTLEYVDITHDPQPGELPYVMEGSWEEGNYHYSKIKVTQAMTTYLFLARISADYQSLEMNYNSTTSYYPSSIVVGSADYVKLER